LETSKKNILLNSWKSSFRVKNYYFIFFYTSNTEGNYTYGRRALVVGHFTCDMVSTQVLQYHLCAQSNR